MNIVEHVSFTNYMKLKKKEDQSVDTLILLRRGNKTPMEGVTERKCGTETEGKATQRLAHLGTKGCGCQEMLADRSLI